MEDTAELSQSSEDAFSELVRWSRYATTATQIRNELICELRGRGHTLQAIGDAASLTKGGVAWICKVAAQRSSDES